MKLFNYSRDGDWKSGNIGLGAVTSAGHISVSETAERMGLEVPCIKKDGVLGVERAQAGIPCSVGAALRSEDLAAVLAPIFAYAEPVLLDEETLVFAPPLYVPGKIICVGLNYRKHADETKMPYPKVPIYFAKFSNAINAHGAAIKLRPISEQYDYEAELTIIMGKTCTDVSEEEALDYVFGYTCGNDFSCRDLQLVTSQWTISKTMDGFAPIGPYAVTADEVNPDELRISAYVNGELRQDSNTNDMIFDCKYLISDLSKRMTLQPGDIIMTGTPSGVIMGYPKDKQVWLKKGDTVDIEIEKLGKLSTVLE